MQRTTPRKFATTPGTRDVLPPESMRLLDLDARLRERFRLFGFREVMTPTLEYSEVMDEPRLRDAAFKLFDPDNQMLLLRPEMTTPIARLVAQRLRNSPPPHKLSYSLPVYRRSSVGHGQSAEFHQTGVEIVGSASPAEDAGAIALLVDAFETVGLEASSEFAVVLGQAAFYEGYLSHAAPDAAPQILSALSAKDLVSVDALARELPDEAAAGAREIPRIVGPATDASVLERAERYAVGEAARAALENLRAILSHLEAHGCLGSVILDLGLTGRYRYYTGAVYEAYSPKLGFSVASGGRYDSLLENFGEPLPATGFAISLERLLSVLPDEHPAPMLVLVGRSVEATRAAKTLRSLGPRVLHLAEDASPEQAARYARSVEAAWICYPDPAGVQLAALNGQGAEPFEQTTPDAAAKKVMV